jgi:hypothetical protein
MKPTLGRIVHITWPDGIESSAIITRTRRDSIGMLYADQIDAFIAIPADRWVTDQSQVRTWMRSQ